jgi:D-glycero-alpha-D-manno-heptose-7-phosphate kinase
MGNNSLSVYYVELDYIKKEKKTEIAPVIIRSIAPLRFGLAGGGTDVSPYSDIHGGAILNATISMYARTTIEPNDSGKIGLHSLDNNVILEYNSDSELPIDGQLDLLKGVYNSIVRNFKPKKPLSFKMSTYVDAPPGSGLGSSSTLTVSIIGAFCEWLKIPLGEYDIAKLAYEIERVDLGLAGGKQDQYAATFGGFNYMEFFDNDKVIVNPLRMKDNIVNELEHDLVLYYTQTSRLSSTIIEQQAKNVTNKQSSSIEAMHQLKKQAQQMKEALLVGKINDIGKILDFGWRQKKQMAEGITNPEIDHIYETALSAGATGGKISGAGGGGFMLCFAPVNKRYQVAKALEELGGKTMPYRFVKNGLTTWKI